MLDHTVENLMIVPEDHAKTLMNLTYGEATKANGYA